MEVSSDSDNQEEGEKIIQLEQEIRHIREKRKLRKSTPGGNISPTKTVLERVRLYEQKIISANKGTENHTNLLSTKCENTDNKKASILKTKVTSNNQVDVHQGSRQVQKPLQETIHENKTVNTEVTSRATNESDSPKQFKKRKGTTDKGKIYENMIIANIVIQLVTDDKIRDFYISSNDENFGDFDDVVIEVHTDKEIKTKAIQLKHSDRKKLTLPQLESQSGDFSLLKYFKSFQNIQTKAHEFILFTNHKLEVSDDTKFQLHGKQFNIKPVQIESTNDALKISQKINYYYKFEIVENEWTKQNTSEVGQYIAFFKNFYLYTDQESVHTLRESTEDKFTEIFYSDEETFQKYLKLISDWSIQDGIKDKLNKKWMQKAIALLLVSSQIEPFSSGVVSDKMKILRDAIFKFDVTLFGSTSSEKNVCEAVKQLWGDLEKENIDIKEINRLRINYSLSSNYINDIKNVKETVVLVQVLWLMNRCPLLLKEHESIAKAIQLCPGQKFVLLGERESTKWIENHSVFKNLFDLELKPESYERVMKTFAISLQGKEELSLMDAFGTNEEFLKHVTTNDLLDMLEGPLYINGQKEILPQPYIERHLSRNVIDIKYLENVNEKTAIILNCEDDLRKVKELQNYRLANIDDILRNPSVDQSYRGTNVYTSSKCTESEFREICCKMSDFKVIHYLKFLNKKSLEWIRSNGDVSELQNYKLSNHFKNENEFWSFELTNSINLITGDPGMGKTEITKSLKNKCSSKYWTVLISAQDVNLFFKDSEKFETSAYIHLFENFLLKNKYRELRKVDKEFFKMCLKQNGVVYVWDALDEISFKHLNAVTSLILLLSEKSFIQWITSREHLKSFLENRFSILSVQINQFSGHEQESYIRKRLASHNLADNIELTIDKIKSTFLVLEHIDILGIPLLIFMLTEIIRQNNNYLELLKGIFLLTDLYHYFIQEKFNIFYKNKQSLDIQIPYLARLLNKEKERTLKYYERLALTVVFSEDITKHLNIDPRKCIEKISEDCTSIGLITELQNIIPQFLHGSFAEYLVAVYFSKNFELIPRDVFFDQQYNNVRFFFDMLIATKSPAHITILYKNFSLFETYNEEILTCKDNGGRSALHLICSWGQKFSRLEVTFNNGSYSIENDKTFNGKLETEEYYKAVSDLLNICNISEEDMLHKMTPLSYARKSESLGAEIKLLQTGKLQLEQTYTTDDRINIMYYCAFLGCHEVIELFYAGRLNNYEEINFFTTDFGRTPLIIASANGYEALVECLVKFGAAINRGNKFGRTSLYLASRGGHEKTVESLVRLGADVNRADKYGRTPLYAACLNGHEKTVEFLVKSGAKIDRADQYDETALYVASKNNHERTVKCLVKFGVDLNCANKDQWTALHEACHKGLEIIVEILVESGAEINLCDKNGETPLYIASKNGHEKIVEILVKSRAEINLADNLGWTSLHVASSNGHIEVVKSLVQVGAEINRPDNYSRTAIYRATQKGHIKIIQFLAEHGAMQ